MGDRVDLRRRLGVYPPKQRLAEVRQRRARETADEPFGPDDADLGAVDLTDGRSALEHLDSGISQDRRDLAAASRMEVVIAEDGAHRHGGTAAGIRENRRLLGLAGRRQIAGEQHQVGIALNLVERDANAVSGRLRSVNVTCRRDADHVLMLHFRPRRETAARMDEEFERVLATMKKAGGALNDAEVPWALGGGLACWARGGPETEHDVDFLVRPEDAERAQQALARTGFHAETPPEGWLLKAFDDNVMVDLIHSPQGGPVNDDLLERAELLEVHAMPMLVARLEDVFVQKLLALSEQKPDFSSVLELARSLREQVDWSEVRARTRESPFANAYFMLLDELDIVSSSD